MPDRFSDQDDNWLQFMPTFPNFRHEEPAIDIYQDKNNIYLEVSIVGVNPENIEISIDENVLTIQGKAEEKKEIKQENYLRKEIRKGSFRRVIKLPIEVKGDKAVAETSSGLLKITIPKTAKAVSKAKRIPIKIQ